MGTDREFISGVLHACAAWRKATEGVLDSFMEYRTLETAFGPDVGGEFYFDQINHRWGTE